MHFCEALWLLGGGGGDDLAKVQLLTSTSESEVGFVHKIHTHGMFGMNGNGSIKKTINKIYI